MSWWEGTGKEEPKRQRRRSVYADRPPAESEERWTELGELDRQTGAGFVDYSQASGWQSLHDFLWRRG
jgi:3-hydroxyacyl-CoA dehydrogenase